MAQVAKAERAGSKVAAKEAEALEAVWVAVVAFRGLGKEVVVGKAAAGAVRGSVVAVAAGARVAVAVRAVVALRVVGWGETALRADWVASRAVVARAVGVRAVVRAVVARAVAREAARAVVGWEVCAVDLVFEAATAVVATREVGWALVVLGEATGAVEAEAVAGMEMEAVVGTELECREAGVTVPVSSKWEVVKVG